MDVSTQISAATFFAFLKCPTKAHLLAIGEPAPGTFFVDIEARISSMYKAVATQIVTYGAYENRFLKRMKERYILAPDDIEFVGRLIETSVNLVGCIYGKIYFPTFSNSLKEIGRYLGFEWAWSRASGAATPLLRRAWELGADDKQKHELIG